MCNCGNTYTRYQTPAVSCPYSVQDYEKLLSKLIDNNTNNPYLVQTITNQINTFNNDCTGYLAEIQSMVNIEQTLNG